jgi:DNA-binding GntR family transcriptional regulator
VRLDLGPGTVVSEQMLSERLGIGRTPIREALHRLARERMVRILPHRGVIIADIDVKSQLRLLEVRREVERVVARGAARRANAEERKTFLRLAGDFERSAKSGDDETFMRVDRAFNELCLQAARNDFATGAMRLMNSLSRRFWYVHNKEAADMPEIATLHAEVSRAIATGDEQAAAGALDLLLNKVEEFTRATLDVGG